ncbi:MAG: DUF885 domain-containing protein, partial [Xanthomonadales bacterium]|nr:DUF885 domain-containing protein [Xanthomonadales bacterium]
IAQLRAALSTTEHPKVRQDIEILIRALEDAATSAELNRRCMLPYYNVPATFFFGFRSLLDPRVPADRYPAALTRLKRYTGQEDGYEPLTVLARARTVERLGEPGLIGPYQGQMENDLANAQRYMSGLADIFTESGLEGWEDDLALLEQQVTEYTDWLRAEMLPRARAGHRLPEEIYADNLKNYGVDIDPRDLIRTAQIGFSEIQNEMQSIARLIAEQRGLESGDYRDVIRVLKQDQVPPDEVLPLYHERLSQLEQIIRDQAIISLPERDAAIRLATEAEASAMPAPFLSPPPLIGNTGQPAEFVLVTSDPTAGEDAAVMDDWTHDGVTWTLAVHEARPGHELQFTSMIEGGVSQARAIYAFNSANVEGWGLYAEAIMKPFLPLEGQLFSLQARLARAARAFLDPMVNLGLLEPDAAKDLLMDEVGISAAMAGSEVDRYTFRAPGQATSYYFGYLNMMQLRAEAEIALRDQFVQKDFHDFVLAQGLLPPELLRQAVLEEFVPANRGIGP